MNGEQSIGLPQARSGRPPERVRGAALLVLLLAIVLGIAGMLISALADKDPESERREKTLEVLAQAKQALIAWSVVQGDVRAATEKDGETRKFTYRRPGTLPCPDRSVRLFGEKDAVPGTAPGSCAASAGTSIGRLPWKTLNTENLRDTYGETLWYAVSDKFRNNVSNNYAAINSDARGTLLLYAADGSTLLTPAGEELAAVIFAPGPPLPSQDRKVPSDDLVPSSYLEAFDGKNNAGAAGPFIVGPVRDSAGDLIVNDLAIGLTARELISGLERRALNEAQSALKKYADDHGRYPNPAPFHASDCTSSITDVRSAIPLCASDVTTPACYGRLPEDVFVPEGFSPEALFPYAAPWFLQNGWGRVMIYAVHDDGAGCTIPLKVGEAPKNYVLFAPGTARQGQSRPSAALSDYLEDAANSSWSGDFDFVVPEWGGNDQLRTDP
jgi:hypothetical protein